MSIFSEVNLVFSRAGDFQLFFPEMFFNKVISEDDFKTTTLQKNGIKL